MASTTQNINRTVETAVPMTRFSISEDEDDIDVPPTCKRPRFSEAASQSRTTIRISGSFVASDVPIQHVQSDWQRSDEHEVEDDDDVDESEAEEGEEEVEEVEDLENSENDYYSSDIGEAEPVSDGQNQQHQSTFSTSASLLPWLSNEVFAHPTVSATSPVSKIANGELQVVLTDPDVLDCPICLEPLCIPVFQCENGHIACSSCCLKVNQKCPSCCMPIGYNRCRAIEKVIESIKIPCQNTQYGCKELMTYSKKTEHEQTCPHTACFCPYGSCHFTGSSKNMYLHFGIQHAASTTRFTYNTPFSVPLSPFQKRHFLQEQHESVVFILNHHSKSHGLLFSIDCVGSSLLTACFEYQITAKSMGPTLSLHCVPEVYAKWSDHTLSKNYLTVPSGFFDENTTRSLTVCIKKINEA